MSRTFVCSDPDEREAGIRAAVAVIHRGGLVVVPTDTVYGIAADAFSPAAVDSLLAAKLRSRDMPVPVLVGSAHTLDGLAPDRSQAAQDLVDAFWPGGLTLVLRHTSSLAWDLGEARGTVALRMPLHPVVLELLGRTGPLAVSSANISGSSAAITAAEAEAQLNGAVEVYLDGGPCAEPVPSTIIDLTGPVPRLVRVGAVPTEDLLSVVPDLLLP
ncbi:MAG: L-threonylcarbamoyladenylate synthase [Frankiales bacterium]|nr:L-threonylcarbamoyladenylate synthase [Frankiales bacterium]MDX6245015.1 L-threonylcarbamoyladenylate synthase [Frankiales bacterium]